MVRDYGHRGGASFSTSIGVARLVCTLYVASVLFNNVGGMMMTSLELEDLNSTKIKKLLADTRAFYELELLVS